MTLPISQKTFARIIFFLVTAWLLAAAPIIALCPGAWLGAPVAMTYLILGPLLTASGAACLYAATAGFLELYKWAWR